MPVPVVDIRKVRVTVRERLMRMEMCMRFFPVPRKVVLVLMVHVVAMPMIMGKCFVCVVVRMPFTDVQPYADCHEETGNIEGEIGCFAQQGKR